MTRDDDEQDPSEPEGTPRDGEGQPEVDGAAGSEDRPLADGGVLTLDAFERAVSQALADKLGPGDAVPTGAAQKPGSAEEMVASVLAALTGRDAKSALREVKEKLAAPPEARPERDDTLDDDAPRANVIDLAAARQARKRPEPSEMSKKIGETLKQTFNEFLAGHVAERGHSGEVTLDADFFKEHGPKLLGNLFQGLASTLLPNAKMPGQAPREAGKLRPVDIDELEEMEREAAKPKADDVASDERVGTPRGEDAGAGLSLVERQAEEDAPPEVAADDTPAPAPTASPPADPVKINVRFDLGSLLGALIQGRRQKPSPAPAPAPSEEGSPTPDGEDDP